VEKGYLVLKEPVSTPSRLDPANVDWARTTAWGAGGYYGRLFLNVRGREPQGLIAPEDYEATRDRLVAELQALGDPEGRPIGTVVHKPEDLYRAVRGIAPPDLFVYFGDLRWRSVGTIGGPIHTFENDTGPDDANHAPNGLIMVSGPGVPALGPVPGMQLMDVTPTVLRLFGLDVPDDVQGRPIGPILDGVPALA
jgi:predicted AlkP superfamily phosphohydrolase/phosphomutase